jgi:hypothetical protein
VIDSESDDVCDHNHLAVPVGASDVSFVLKMMRVITCCVWNLRSVAVLSNIFLETVVI